MFGSGEGGFGIAAGRADAPETRKGKRPEGRNLLSAYKHYNMGVKSIKWLAKWAFESARRSNA